MLWDGCAVSKFIKKKNSQFFGTLRRLESWFERRRRILPWRDKPTLYRVWISEIMLQQTQVATVIPYFERFLTRFPDIETLAQSSEDEVLSQWAGLGYYSRARNLHRTAILIGARGFPKDRETWLELPGIGNYTAGAILSIALNQPEPILDGNVERVLSRVYRNSDKKLLWRAADFFVKSAFEKKIAPSILNQALMELGATVCSPKKPACQTCPLKSFCQARSKGDPENFPTARKKKIWLQIQEELYCLIANETQTQILVRKRLPGEWRAGLWDLPNRQELEDIFPRFSARTSWKSLGRIETRHIVTRHKISRTTHLIQGSGARFCGKVPQGFQWISASTPGLAFGSALRRTLKKLRETFPEALQ